MNGRHRWLHEIQKQIFNSIQSKEPKKQIVNKSTIATIDHSCSLHLLYTWLSGLSSTVKRPPIQRLFNSVWSCSKRSMLSAIDFVSESRDPRSIDPQSIYSSTLSLYHCQSSHRIHWRKYTGFRLHKIPHWLHAEAERLVQQLQDCTGQSALSL